MAWIDFVICLFLGMFGVHKFKEKKTGMGLLYLFTFGLFGFGWLFDCIKYAIAAIKPQNIPAASISFESVTASVAGPNNVNKLLKVIKAIALWYLTGILLILMLVFMPSFSSILFLVCAAIVIPIAKWQNIIGKYIKGKVKVIAVISIILLSLITLPAPDLPDNVNIPSNTTSSTTDTTSSATEYTTQAVTDSTTQPTTEPNTEPTAAAHTHSYTSATCTQPKTCSCGATEGSAKGHAWESATCTKPKTCSSCGTTSGSANGHYYSGGKCTACSASDPNHNTITYILNTVSKKFHRISCSRLPTDNREDTTLSREEIIELGYEPCGHCDP